MTLMRFLALPVKEGDAFYLQRGDFHILVDGGRGDDVVRLLRQHCPEVTKLNIVACTHNDSDHTEGIICLLKDQRFRIDQLILPATWLDVVEIFKGKELLCLDEIRDQLWKILCDQKCRYFDVRTLVHEVVSTFGKNRENFCNVDYENDDSDDLNEPDDSQSCVAVDYIDNELFFIKEGLEYISGNTHHFNEDFAGCDIVRSQIYQKLLCKILKYARNIFEIIDLVNSRRRAGERIQIKYLRRIDNCTIDDENADKNLVPVNAKVAKIGKGISVEYALYTLCLTIENRMSLAFWSPETDECPGVLFCGDGSFRLNGKQPQRQIICTTPHHGSKSDLNVKMYQEVNTWAKKEVIWVRSDSVGRRVHENKYRPCLAYIKQENRFCTRCNTTNSSYQEQVVEFLSEETNWVVPGKNIPCDCIAR